MSDTTTHDATRSRRTDPTPRPWHLSVVSAIFTIWSLAALTGFVITLVGNADALSTLSPDIETLLDRLPAWASVARSVGILAGPTAAALLVLRSRHAFTALVVLLAALALGTTGEQSIVPPDSMRATTMIVTKIVNWTVAIGMIGYCHHLRLSRVLR